MCSLFLISCWLSCLLLLCVVVPASCSTPSLLHVARSSSVPQGNSKLLNGGSWQAPLDVDLGVSKEERFERLKKVASVPLKGWNSYDSFLGSANESVVMAHIDYISAHLLPYGYTIVCMDAGWFDGRNSVLMDGYGRPQVDPVRYPSAVGEQGFKHLSAYAHSKGLLLGIHTMRGAHKQAIALQSPILGTQYTVDQIANMSAVCWWWTDFYGINMSHPGAQPYINSLYAQYAEWGIDFIKNDCIFARDMMLDNIVGISNAIYASGREMLYSLSPGPGATLQQSDAVKNITNMYRITDDVWDSWAHLQDHIVNNVVSIVPNIGWPNGRWGLPSFPDLDMLPLGTILEPGTSKPRPTQLTPDEQMTMVTYWCIWRAPLIYGGDLRNPDAYSLGLVTNLDALTVTDHSRNNGPVAGRGVDMWRADHESYATNGISYLTIHNWYDQQRSYNISTADAVPKGTTCQVKDIWAENELGPMKTIQITLRPHASVFYILHDCTSEEEGKPKQTTQ